MNRHIINCTVFEVDLVVKRLLAVFCMFSLLGIPSGNAGIVCPQRATVRVRNVVFGNTRSLSLHQQQVISGEIGAWYKPGFAANVVRRGYEAGGYFKVQVDEEVVPVADDRTNHYDVIVRVLDEGKQYRLGDLTFNNAKDFSEGRLRRLFRIRRGEIFSWDQINQGLDKLRRLYESRGYIYVIAVSTTEPNDENQTVNVHVEIAEGKQLRFPKMSNSNAQPRAVMGFDLTPTDLFDPEVWTLPPIGLNVGSPKPDPGTFKPAKIERDSDHYSPCPTLKYECEVNGSATVCHRSIQNP